MNVHRRPGILSAARRALRGLAGAALIGLAAGAGAAPSPDAGLAAWRDQVVRTRALAENDVPQAYVDAQRLLAEMPVSGTPRDRAHAMNVLARTETYLGLTAQAARHAEEAYRIATQEGDRIGQAESDLSVALNSINQGRLDLLVTVTMRSVTELEGTDRTDLLCEALLRTAIMYRRFEQFEESVSVAVQAMEIASRSKDPLALAYAHQGLAIAYDQSYRAKEASEHYLEQRRQARIAGSRLMEAFAISGLARLEDSQHHLQHGEQLEREALEYYRITGARYAYAFGLYGLSENLRMQGRTREALDLSNQATEIFEKYPNPIGLWFMLNARSVVYQALGDVESARKDAEHAYDVARDLGIALYLSDSALRMSSISAARGDYRRAWELAQEAREMTSKAAREKASTRMLELTKRYEAENRQHQIDELTRSNETKSAELRQRELQQRWLWTILATSVVLLATTGYFLQRLRRSDNDMRALNAGLEQRVQERTSELRQHARYLRTLIDMLPMWAWFKDTQGRYVVTNQAHAHARGHGVDQMLGRTDTDLLKPELAKAYRADDAEVQRSRGRKTTEETLVLGDGPPTWMETYKAAVLDEDGTLLGTVGVARNISDRKAAEAAREQALAEAERLARLRSQFLAQMSHELRTPLNGILGFAQLLLGDRPLTERQQRGLGIIQQSGRHLMALIDDVLDIARVDAGRLELHPGPMDLGGFLHVVADIVRVKADEKNLLFRYEPASHLPGVVMADEMRLRQVLLNLLSNAVKFTDHGVVQMRVLALDPGGRPMGGTARLRFEVEDSGIGMTEEQVERLFQPFEQVSEARRRVGGTGLGLAISHRLVKLMGSDIRLRSHAGGGTCFWFDLEVPMVDRAHEASHTIGEVVGYAGRRLRVLVVDDAAAVRAFLADTLAGLGFDVHEASDGQRGLQAAAAIQPDLVLMDVAMPGIDGLETTRRLRQTPHGRAIRVVLMSAQARRLDEPQWRDTGADAFLPKPIERDALLETMGTLLDLAWETPEADTSASANGKAREVDFRSLFEPPPAEELIVLRKLARLGNMRDIRARAEHLRTLDPRYEAFATRLRTLADRYESRAVRAFIDAVDTMR